MMFWYVQYAVRYEWRTARDESGRPLTFYRSSQADNWARVYANANPAARLRIVRYETWDTV